MEMLTSGVIKNVTFDEMATTKGLIRKFIVFIYRLLF